MYRLVYLTGNKRGQRVAVRGGSTMIGRKKGCEIHVEDDKGVAPKHVRLEYRPDGVYMKKVSDSAPVFCNGKQVESRKLVSGDELEIGETKMLFQEIRNTGVAHRRKTSKMQMFAIISALFVILLEIGFVVGFSVYRSRQIPEAYAGSPTVSSNDTAEAETVSATNRLVGGDPGGGHGSTNEPAGRRSRKIEVFTPDVDGL